MESAERIEERTLGRILLEERERQGLSRAEAAQRIHMSVHQVEALETEDYERLPQGTFLRGFVRNYAKSLGLDPAAMVARLNEVGPSSPAPGIVVPTQNIRFDPLGERLASPYIKAGGIAFVLVAIAFAAMYWWMFIRPTPPAAASAKGGVAPGVTSGPPQQIASPPATSSDPPPPPTPAPTEPAAPSGQEPAASATQAGTAAPAAAQPPASAGAGAKTLRFRFRGESWVEVRDRHGRALLSRLNPPGSEAEVAGTPPFAITIGNAAQVELAYGDREVPLEPHTKVAVARLTLE